MGKVDLANLRKMAEIVGGRNTGFDWDEALCAAADELEKLRNLVMLVRATCLAMEWEAGDLCDWLAAYDKAVGRGGG